MSKKRRIGIIGAGNIGFNLAEILALQGYNVLLHNRFQQMDGQPSAQWLEKMGHMMDLNDSLQYRECGTVVLTHLLEHLDHLYALVITTGAKRTSPRETREDLAVKNMSILEGYLPYIAAHPDLLVLVVTNPVDCLTRILIEKIANLRGVSCDVVGKKIVGVSYIDSMRLCNVVRLFLAEHYPEMIHPDITGYSIGEHGPSMVPVMSRVMVNHRPLSALADAAAIAEMAQQTILRGNDIITLTGASAVTGPAHAAMRMIHHIHRYPAFTFPCSVWDGHRTIGRLVRFIYDEVAEIIELDLSPAEQDQFQHSEMTVEAQYQHVLRLLKEQPLSGAYTIN